MKKRNAHFAVLEIKYWKRSGGYNYLSGHGVVYGYVVGNWLFAGDCPSNDYYQDKYLITANRVISVEYASNLLELKKLITLYGEKFDQDDFIRFLKSNNIVFQTHPTTALQKNYINELSYKIRLKIKERRHKQYKANQKNHRAKYLRTLAREGKYREFLDIFFKYHKRLNLSNTRCYDIKVAVYHNNLFKMPSRVREALIRRGIRR